jgi:hypothetical protein
MDSWMTGWLLTSQETTVPGGIFGVSGDRATLGGTV